MSWRESFHIRKSRSRRLKIHLKKQKVPNRVVVQVIRNSGMDFQTVCRTAENEMALLDSIVEGPDTEMIPGAEQLSSGVIPNCKRKVADQVFDTLLAPSLVSIEN